MNDRFPDVSFSVIDPRKREGPAAGQRRIRGALADKSILQAVMAAHGSKLSVSKLEDWYNVSFSKVATEDRYLLNKYRSLHGLLAAAYPEHPWLPWKFPSISRNFWALRENRIWFLTWLEKELQMETSANPSAWFASDLVHIFRENGAAQLSRMYPTVSQLKELFAEAWPQVDWRSVKIERSDSLSWKSADLQREFLSRLAKEISKTDSLEGFYLLSYNHIRANGGGGLLTMYDSSLFKALQHLYPEHDWNPWKFSHGARKFWQSPRNQLAFFDWCAKKLNVQKPEDWYSVSVEDIMRLGGTTLLVSYHGRSLRAALSAAYGSHVFELWHQKKEIKTLS